MNTFCSPQTAVLARASGHPHRHSGLPIRPADGSDARDITSSMNDTIEPTSDHDAETPMAEYLQVRDPSGTPPNRSNSPAAGSSEGITAGLGALQVLSSPDTAHDETWNSFLDVCPFPACTSSSITPSTRLLLTLHLDFTETFRGRQYLKGTSIFVSQTCTVPAPQAPLTPVAHPPPPPCRYGYHCLDAYVYRYPPPQANLQISRGFPGRSIPLCVPPHHVQNTMYDVSFSVGSRRRFRFEWRWSEISSLLPPNSSISECILLAAGPSRCAKHTFYLWTAPTTHG